MEKDNVVVLDVETSLDIPADRVLSGAMSELESVIVIGRRHDGTLHVASSMADAAEFVFMVELAKRRVLDNFK